MSSSGPSSSSTTLLSEDDRKFMTRILKTVETVQAWDDDPTLLQECRWQIPWDELRGEKGDGAGTASSSPYIRHEEDYHLSGNALLLQRLCRYFKETMTWINSPECVNCGNKQCTYNTTRGPETQEEREGGATRVEVYECSQCCDTNNNNKPRSVTITTFPRYNSVRKLLETKCGRCGEYANLFGLYCRSVGFETRYVLDVTDHVWTEVYLVDQDQWIMADGCEGIINKPSMYEHGWGKQGLCYMIGVGIDHVMDVTPRYTRKWLDDDFQTRRRTHTSSEHASSTIIDQINRQLQQSGGIPKTRIAELDRRRKLEEAEFQVSKQATEWTEQEKYGRGRISGSLAWKQSRHEAGNDNSGSQTNNNDTKETKERTTIAGFQIEPFYPPSLITDKSERRRRSVTISVTPPTTLSKRGEVASIATTSRHDAIIVSDVPCAVGEHKSISVVIVDEVELGCILQSRSFDNWIDLNDFASTLPSQRIVIMNGSIPISEEQNGNKLPLESLHTRLGGWKEKDTSNCANGFIFIGQVDLESNWTVWSTWDECPNGYMLSLQSPEQNATSSPSIRLRTERNAIPSCVAGRLPEIVMPLATQLLASEEQKRLAFTKFVSSTPSRYSGYTTKANAPVYLLDATAYPLHRTDIHSSVDSKSDSWNTFHYLSSPLVPEDDNGISESAKQGAPNYDIPLDVNFFTNLIGSQLLVKAGSSSSTLLPTQQALQNCRLIGLYFSAHWCGPCRSFTPMLAEMYEHLKEVHPTHGLEIVFVSSDRDQSSFQQYFGTMPWQAIPFEVVRNYKQLLNMTYGVRGIPSLVVLDAVSGQVVIPGSDSRREVMMACQGGELSIETMIATWFERAPPETIEMLSMLELSCQDHGEAEVENDDADNPYLKLDKPSSGGTMGPSPLTSEVVLRTNEVLVPRPVDTTVKNIKEWNTSLPGAVSTVLSTALKYLENAIKEPWTPKFRTFRLSNKVADKITRIEGGIGLLQSLGFEIFGTDHDFMATIPLLADLDSMKVRIESHLAI